MQVNFSFVLFSALSGVSPGIRQARGAASRANHLQLQSGPAGLLKQSPSAPWSSRSDRQQTASRPAWPQKTWFYSSTSGLELREGEGEGMAGVSTLRTGGRGPALQIMCCPNTKLLYIFILFLNSPLMFFFLLLPPFHFEQGQCFVYSADGKPLLVFAWSLWSCSTAHKHIHWYSREKRSSRFVFRSALR